MLVPMNADLRSVPALGSVLPFCNHLVYRCVWSDCVAMAKFGFYEVDRWGDELGRGATRARLCTLSGIAKLNCDDSKYAVAHEYICWRLAAAIGLPVPPGVVVRTDDSDLAYVSVQFGPSGELPPPVIAEDFVRDHPTLAAGVIAFDCWIANYDRHDENLAYSSRLLPPAVFDHDLALMGNMGPERLESLMEDGIAGNCLCGLITDARHFRIWSDRIASLPDGLVQDICEHITCDGGLTAEQATATARFLVCRKPKVGALLRSSSDSMPRVTQWDLT